MKKKQPYKEQLDQEEKKERKKIFHHKDTHTQRDKDR